VTLVTQTRNLARRVVALLKPVLAQADRQRAFSDAHRKPHWRSRMGLIGLLVVIILIILLLRLL